MFISLIHIMSHNIAIKFIILKAMYSTYIHTRYPNIVSMFLLDNNETNYTYYYLLVIENNIWVPDVLCWDIDHVHITIVLRFPHQWLVMPLLVHPYIGRHKLALLILQIYSVNIVQILYSTKVVHIYSSCWVSKWVICFATPGSSICHHKFLILERYSTNIVQI